MNNKNNGVMFESQLKAILKSYGRNVFSLSIPETADLIMVNGRTYLIECKTTHSEIWKIKNFSQYERLKSYALKGIAVFYAIKFTIKHKSEIRIYNILDPDYPYTLKNGFTIEEFIQFTDPKYD